MFDAALIVLIGFISFIAIAFRYGYKKSLAGLDQQIAQISATVEKAKQALIQAEEKHSFEVKYRTVIEEEIDGIYKKLRHQVEEMKAQATIDFDKAMQAKIHHADSLMDRKRIEVINELQHYITTTAIKALGELFTHHLPEKTHADINTASLEKLENLLQKMSGEDRKEFTQKKIVNGN